MSRPLKDYKVSDRDPESVDDIEIKKLTERKLETDWIFTESRDKYQEYKVNGSPRKKYLQMRYKYKVQAKTVMGGVSVHVDLQEEIEKLGKDGQGDGFSSVSQTDSSRTNELLDKINLAILSAPNIQAN